MGGATGYDVFLSYRRERSAEAARLLQFALKARGLRVFLDIKDLGAGYFDETLLDVIGEAVSFIVLLAPGALDRCADESDWLRREIEHAIELERNVVPILMEGFRFPPPAELPETLVALPRCNAISYNHEYFDAMVERLVGFLGVGTVATAVAEPVRPAARAFVVFLSFGGVLRTASSATATLDEEPTRRFAKFLRRHPGALVAITSSWKLTMSVAELRRLFPPDIRDRIVGVTGDAYGRTGVCRSAEAQAFLGKHPDLPTCWVAIDHYSASYQANEPVLVVDGARGFDAGAEEELERLLVGVLSDDAADGESVREHALAVDCTGIHPGLYRGFSDWPKSFQQLLDMLWSETLSRWVPRRSYGTRWTLCLPGSDKPIDKTATPDERSLEAVGIERGSVLLARLRRE